VDWIGGISLWGVVGREMDDRRWQMKTKQVGMARNRNEWRGGRWTGGTARALVSVYIGRFFRFRCCCGFVGRTILVATGISASILPSLDSLCVFSDR